MQSPLSHLMELTNTTAKQISDYTGINVTLLSKFKNKQRKINYNSKYPALLSEYFLNSKEEQARHIVHNFLISKDPSLENADTDKLKDFLALWLTSDNSDYAKTIDTANNNSELSSVFSEVNGLKEPLELFTEHVLSAAPGNIGIIHDFPDGGTFYTSLLDFSLPYLERMKEHGCSLYILDTCQTPKTYMSIHNWLNFYFSDQVRIFSEYENSGLQRMVFLLENECALVILGSGAGQKAFLSTFYHSDTSIQFFQNSALYALSNSTNLIEKIPFRNIMEFLQILDISLTAQPTTYLVNPVMMYKTMNPEILDQVLADNDIPEAERKPAFEQNRFTAYLRTKCPYKQIYNLSAMLEIAAQEYYIDEELTALYGHPVRVSRKHLHEHVKFLSQLNAPENYHILFVPFKNLHLLHNSVSYVVQDNGIFLAWDASRSDHRIYSRDTSVIKASYTYMEEIWNSIPAEYLSPEWQNEQLQKLLDLTKE